VWLKRGAGWTRTERVVRMVRRPATFDEGAVEDGTACAGKAEGECLQRMWTTRYQAVAMLTQRVPVLSHSHSAY
jgi:hypothetical protein